MIKIASKNLHTKNSGFTILELLVCIAIFAFMTAFLIAKYGTFNQSVLLTNLAYDTAITIRSAQTFGLGVLGSSASAASQNFAYSYGVHFDLEHPQTFSMLFYDPSTYDTIGTNSVYTMKPQYQITSLCVGSGPDDCPLSPAVTFLDILFVRPNPDAIIIPNENTSISTLPSYAEVVFTAIDGSTKKIIVRSTGEVAVSN